MHANYVQVFVRDRKHVGITAIALVNVTLSLSASIVYSFRGTYPAMLRHMGRRM